MGARSGKEQKRGKDPQSGGYRGDKEWRLESIPCHEKYDSRGFMGVGDKDQGKNAGWDQLETPANARLKEFGLYSEGQQSLRSD